MEADSSLDSIFKVAGEPAACLARCGNGIQAVLEVANSCSNGMEVIQIFKNDGLILGRLAPAYLCAALRKADGSMRAKTLANEMLLFVAGNMNIGKALALCGASGNDFIVFATSKKLMGKFLLESESKMLKECALTITDVAGDVAVADLTD